MSAELAILVLGALAALGEPRGRWELPREAEVGERVRATLVVEHDADARPKLSELAFDDTWIAGERSAPSTRSDPSAPGRLTTTWTIELAALEPGERALPAPVFAAASGALEVEPATLSVRGLLAEGEDQPRPVRGPHELEGRAGRSGAWKWILGGSLAALAALVLLGRRLRARASAPAAAPAPSVRLAALEAQPLDTPADVQAAHVALTRLLRESGDRRAGRERAALTDEEWCADAGAELDAAGLDGAERRALALIFERAAAVKYGSERPTHWATRETLAAARAFAARLESAAAPAPRREAAA